MKNTMKFLGFIALVAVMGMTVVGCDLFGNKDDDKNGDGDSTAVTFSSVTANGSSSQTTTQLTLTFSQAITGLSAADITLSGVSVTKGTVSGSGPTYTLPISGFTTGGTLNVAVAKSGYTVSGSPKTVTIYYSSGNTGNTALNGTWVATDGAAPEAAKWIFDNGNFELSGNYEGSITTYKKGTYTTSSNQLTFNTTHMHGDFLKIVMPSGNFESKWYTKTELVPILTTLGVSNPENGADQLLSIVGFTYSISGNRLTMSAYDYSLTYTKQ